MLHLFADGTVLHVLFQAKELNVCKQPIVIEEIKGKALLKSLQVIS